MPNVIYAECYKKPFTLSVINKPFKLSVITKPCVLSVVILCVAMLNVVAPNKEPFTLKLFTAVTNT